MYKARQTFASTGPANHFFGYYDVSPFDAEGNRLLAVETNLTGRIAQASDRGTVGYFDLETGKFHPLGVTGALNFQQGCRLQWLGPDFSSRVIFNQRTGNRVAAQIVDIASGEKTLLPAAVTTLTRDGRNAIFVDYERHVFTRPSYSYAGIENAAKDGRVLADDGLFHMDMESGETRVLISLADLMNHKPVSSMQSASHSVEHPEYSPRGTRVLFYHRWKLPDGSLFTRPYVMDIESGVLHLLSDSGRVTHSTWRNENEVVFWGASKSPVTAFRRSNLLARSGVRPLIRFVRRLIGSNSMRKLVRDSYQLVDVTTGRSRTVGSDSLTRDGHPSFSPVDENLMLTDTYQDEDLKRHLIIYDLARNEKSELGRFHSPAPSNDTGWRCDLHPRWDRTGTRVCIDSLHSGTRQVYVFDLQRDA